MEITFYFWYNTQEAQIIFSNMFFFQRNLTYKKCDLLEFLYKIWCFQCLFLTCFLVKIPDWYYISQLKNNAGKTLGIASKYQYFHGITYYFQQNCIDSFHFQSFCQCYLYPKRHDYHIACEVISKKNIKSKSVKINRALKY